jgi:hypothetical protein
MNGKGLSEDMAATMSGPIVSYLPRTQAQSDNKVKKASKTSITLEVGRK